MAVVKKDDQWKRWHRVRWIATGLLLVMVALYAVARTFEGEHEAWLWVVVERQKDRLGAALGQFVHRNFLTPEVLTEQVRRHGVVKKMLIWLAEPDNAWRVARSVEKQAPLLLRGESFRKNCDSVAAVMCQKLATTPVESGVGRWMSESMKGDEFRAVVAPIFGKLASAVAGSKDWVESEAGESAPLQKTRLLSRLSKRVAKVFSGKMVGQLSEQLVEASGDTTHPLFDKLEEALGELGTELQGGKEVEELGYNDWARYRERVFRSEGTKEAAGEFLYRVGELLLLEKEGLVNKTSLAISRMAKRVSEDEAELLRWEYEVVNLLKKVSGQYGDAFEQLVRSRVEAWDGKTLVEKLESSVGADLQYIRINGTLIGGLIGVILHAVGGAIWG